MSLFGKIAAAIFGSTEAHADGLPQAPADSPGATTVAVAPAPVPGSGSAPVTPTVATQPAAPTSRPPSSAPSAAPAPAAAKAPVDVAAVLDKLTAKAGQKLNWRVSIVDLMKLLGLDSGLAARKELAKELHYTGDTSDSAKMNIWLHKQVMTKLADNGGVVPAELRH